MARAIARWVCLLLYLHFPLSLSSVRQLGPNEPAHDQEWTWQGLCDDVQVAAVANSNSGTILFLSFGGDPFVLEIPGHPLPTLECGENFHRCNPLIYDFKKHLFIIIPSVRSFLWSQYSTDQDFPPQANFQEISLPCNPTRFNYRGGESDSRLLMACFNLTAQEDGFGSLYYVDFLFSVTDNVTMFTERRSSTRTPIYGIDTVSEAVFASDLAADECFIDEELYVFDQSFPLHTSTEPFRSPSFVTESSIDGCEEYHHVEYSGLGRLVVYCKNQSAVLYDLCMNEASYYSQNTTGIPYPCTRNWDHIVYRQTNKLLIVSSTSDINATEIDFGHEINYGVCAASNRDIYFWGLTENGSLIMVSLSTQEQTVVNICSDATSTSLKPVLLNEIHSYFDSATRIVTLINTTNEHLNLPEIQLSFNPDMYTIHTGPNTHTCMHTSTPITSIPTQATSVQETTTNKEVTTQVTTAVHSYAKVTQTAGIMICVLCFIGVLV